MFCYAVCLEIYVLPLILPHGRLILPHVAALFKSLRNLVWRTGLSVYEGYKLRSLEILAQNRVISFVHLGCVYSSKCCNASEHVTHVCACALTLLRLLGYERYTSATRQHALCNVIMILLLKEKGVNTWIHFLRLNLFA